MILRTVGLSGAGGLTIVGVPKVSRTIGLSGSGTLSVVRVPRFNRTTALSGVGTLGVQTTFRPLQIVEFYGSGSLSASKQNDYNSYVLYNGEWIPAVPHRKIDGEWVPSPTPIRVKFEGVWYDL